MKVLQLYYKTPFPAQDGGALSILNTSKALLDHSGVELKILSMDLKRSGTKNDDIPAAFIHKTRFEKIEVDNNIYPLKALRNLFGDSSYFVDRFWSEEFANRLTSILEAEAFDIVQLEHVYLGLYSERIRQTSKAKIVLRSQNVEHLLWREYIANSPYNLYKPFLKIATRRLELFEKSISNLVDGIMAISENDASYFREVSKARQIEYIPIPMAVLEVPRQLNGSNMDQQLPFYHIGSMDWKPNILGMKWFINDILPLVIEHYPGFRMNMAGKNMSPWFFKRQCQHLNVLGSVPDSIAFHQKNSVMIVPLLNGGGVRVKILEGLAMGKTIITTDVGVRGIAYEADRHVLIANTPKEFVHQIGRCLTTPGLRDQMEDASRHLISQQHDPAMIARRMQTFYEGLV